MTQTLPFPVRPRRAGEPEPDLTIFALIHRAMRSGTRMLAEVITNDAPMTAERRAAIADFASRVLTEIHSHHRKEDDVLWPVIVASAAGHADLSKLTGDHQDLERILVRADALVARFKTGGNDDHEVAGELSAVFAEIAAELDEHIADEEATVFPILRAHVSVRDFARCEKHFQKGTSVKQLAFLLPWFVSQCSEDERRELLPTAPAPMRFILRVAEPRWQRKLALVRGWVLRSADEAPRSA